MISNTVLSQVSGKMFRMPKFKIGEVVMIDDGEGKGLEQATIINARTIGKKWEYDVKDGNNHDIYAFDSISLYKIE